MFLQSCFSFITDSSWARFGVFKPHVNGTDSSIRTPALDDFLNTGKKTPKKPPLSPNSRATPMPLHVSHIPFIANYWGFLLLFIKKHISLYLQFTVKLLAQFPILEFYFLTLACYFVGLKTFFFLPAIHLTARTFQLTSGAEGHAHKDQQLQPLRAPGTPCQIRGLGASLARLAEEHVCRQSSHSLANNAPY